MNNLLILPNKSVTGSATRIVGIGLTLAVLLLFGCASSRDVVPISDGAAIDTERRSATKTDEGVKVTAQGAAWDRNLRNLEGYVTPFYITIRNDTASTLAFGYDDLTLLGEDQTQYNPLPPEAVAQILRGSYHASGPTVSVGLGTGFGIGDGVFSFFNLFFPVWSPSGVEKVGDVFAQALVPGLVRQNSTLQGFVYFKKVPEQVERVTLNIGYRLGESSERHELSFPFALR